MPVLDASAVVEYLGGGPLAAEARAVITARTADLWAPHLIDAEVGHVLRRAVRAGELPEAAAGAALDDLAALPLVRAAHTSLLARAWELRDNVSFSDALYVALAERVGDPLVTVDLRLARAASSLVEVQVLGLSTG